MNPAKTTTLPASPFGKLLLALAPALAAAAIFSTPAPAAVSGPAWEISSVAHPTNFSVEDNAKCSRSSGPLCDQYLITLTNVGSAPTSGPPVSIVDTLPQGVKVVNNGVHGKNLETNGLFGCGVALVITCTDGDTVAPGATLAIFVEVEVTAPVGEVTNQVTVSGGGAPPIATGEPLTKPNTVEGPPAAFGFSALGFAAHDASGSVDTQAGAHPVGLTTTLNLNTLFESPPFSPLGFGAVEAPRNFVTYLPLGFVGNPRAAAQCTELQLTEGGLASVGCPAGSRVGQFTLFNNAGVNSSLKQGFSFVKPLYNMVPEPGYPAKFGFKVNTTTAAVYASVVHTPSGYAVRVAAPGVPRTIPIEGATLSFYGDPHTADGEPEASKAFFTNPSDCSAGALGFKAIADSWLNPGNWAVGKAPSYPEVSGCNQLDFSPTIEALPTTNIADSPSGLDFDLQIPQNEDPEGLATPPLKDASVSLPEGLTVNPSSADGLTACPATGSRGINVGSDQIGLEGQDYGDPQATELGDGRGAPDEPPYSDGLYHTAPGHCPLASQLGTVDVTTPLLEEPLHGHVYLGQPECGPCTNQDAKEGKLLKLYIEAAGPSAIIKLPGEVSVDPTTGRLTATFEQGPQQPFSDLKLHFKQGARAALRTPSTCGDFETVSDLKPWSAPETPDATPSSSFKVTSAPGGAPCPATKAARPFAPGLSVGTLVPAAGTYAPLSAKVTRTDGAQELGRLDFSLPAGLSARLAGIPYCPSAQLTAAEGKSARAEKENPSCPLASQIGTVNVGAGAGPTPFYVQGRAYLSGPYKGAPLSLAVITPALAGPFDLGTVVVKTALQIDPETARVHALSDPLPSSLAGVPLDVRSVAVNVDRAQFTLNPTSCNPFQITSQLTSTEGAGANPANPFQVGGCKALDFSPQLAFKLKGATKRGRHPALTATLSAKPGQANIAKASVALPHSEFLDQAHIGTICTRVQFAADQCPAASVYGHATAITPLLDAPLHGPVYLRSSDNPLPDLVASLDGQIHVVLDGRIDSVHGGIRTSFEAVPDAPVSKFTLSMLGGRKGLLVNSTNLCARTSRATVLLDGQNAKAHDTEPLVANSCARKAKKGHHHRAH